MRSRAANGPSRRGHRRFDRHHAPAGRRKIASNAFDAKRSIRDWSDAVATAAFADDVSGRVANKHAIVTGGAGGIGFAIAELLAKEGARILLADVDATSVTDASRVLREAGHDVDHYVMDVSSEAAWQALSDDRSLTAPPLDILINAAGIFATVRHPIDAIPFAEWRHIMQVNLDSVFLGTRHAVARMKHTGGGSIVNIGSMAGARASRGGAAYGASKGGVAAFTRQAAFSCAREGYNVRVNCVLPGYVWTPGIAKLAEAEYGDTAAARNGYAERHPLKCAIDGADIAWAALYLVSDESRAVTGVEIPVDGGLMASLWGVQ